MWPNFVKSVLMSHLTTQIFMKKLRKDIQPTLQWLQFVQSKPWTAKKLCEKHFKVLTYGHIKLCNSVCFNVT